VIQEGDLGASECAFITSNLQLEFPESFENGSQSIEMGFKILFRCEDEHIVNICYRIVDASQDSCHDSEKDARRVLESKWYVVEFVNSILAYESTLV
jgi:hypothetical protein